MFSGFSLSSITNSLSELTSELTKEASHITASIASSITEVIDQSKKEFEQEEAKNAVKREQLHQESNKQTVDITRNPRTAPWFTTNESVDQSLLKSRIFKLSTTAKTFLPAVPETYIQPSNQSINQFASRALSEDAQLNRARFRLVPRKLSEERFWRAYIYQIDQIRSEMGAESLGDIDLSIGQSPDEPVVHEELMPLAQPVSLPEHKQSNDQSTNQSASQSSVVPPTLSILSNNHSNNQSNNQPSIESRQSSHLSMSSYDEPDWASDEFVSIDSGNSTPSNKQSINQSINQVNRQAVLNDLDSLLDEMDADADGADDGINEDALLEELEGLDVDKELP